MHCTGLQWALVIVKKMAVSMMGLWETWWVQKTPIARRIKMHTCIHCSKPTLRFLELGCPCQHTATRKMNHDHALTYPLHWRTWWKVEWLEHWSVYCKTNMTTTTVYQQCCWRTWGGRNGRAVLRPVTSRQDSWWWDNDEWVTFFIRH